MTRLLARLERRWSRITRRYDANHRPPTPMSQCMTTRRKPMTNVTKPIGFRRTQPFGDNPTGVGWAAWVGPLVVSRLQPWQGKRLRINHLNGYVGVSALGLCVSVTR